MKISDPFHIDPIEAADVSIGVFMHSHNFGWRGRQAVLRVSFTRTIDGWTTQGALQLEGTWLHETPLVQDEQWDEACANVFGGVEEFMANSEPSFVFPAWFTDIVDVRLQYLDEFVDSQKAST